MDGATSRLDFDMPQRVQAFIFLSAVVSLSADVAGAQDRVLGALRPISSIQADIRATAGELPTRTLVSTGRRPPERHLGMTFCWQGTNVSYQPLVFEDYNLERHGHNVGCLQPVASAGHFAASVVSLPFKAAFCHEREYELGHVRPGTCAPFVTLRTGRRAGAAASTAALFMLL